MSAHACVCACMRACVRVCVSACVRARMFECWSPLARAWAQVRVRKMPIYANSTLERSPIDILSSNQQIEVASKTDIRGRGDDLIYANSTRTLPPPHAQLDISLVLYPYPPTHPPTRFSSQPFCEPPSSNLPLPHFPSRPLSLFFPSPPRSPFHSLSLAPLFLPPYPSQGLSPSQGFCFETLPTAPSHASFVCRCARAQTRTHARAPVSACNHVRAQHAGVEGAASQQLLVLDPALWQVRVRAARAVPRHAHHCLAHRARAAVGRRRRRSLAGARRRTPLAVRRGGGGRLEAFGRREDNIKLITIVIRTVVAQAGDVSFLYVSFLSH